MKFITVLPAELHKLAKALKVGFEFTFTNAECDADYLCGNAADYYYVRRNRCMNKMERKLKALARHTRSINQCSQEYVQYMEEKSVVHLDPGVIEISAPPTVSARTNALVYDLCRDIAAEYGFVPYRGQECGGMHANVDRIDGKHRYVKPFEQTKEAKKYQARIDKINRLYDKSYYYTDRLWDRYNTRHLVESWTYDEQEIQYNKTDKHVQRHRILRARLNTLRQTTYNDMSNAERKYREKHNQHKWKHGAATAYMLNAFPSIVWTFHAPNDDDSAMIAHSENYYIKNKQSAVRSDPNHEKYMEYRCIGMVGNSDQVKQVHRFFQRFTAWAKLNEERITKDCYNVWEVLAKCVHTQKRLHKFNLKKATRQFYHVCRILNENPEDYRWWLENHLATRFSYDPQYHKSFAQ